MKHIIKASGVYASPCLSQKDEFEHVKLKIKRSIKKLITADMKSHQVHLYFNNCMLTNIFFGCGIVSFNKKQCEELKNIFELPTVRKMGLGNNFPRKLLYVKNQHQELG